jgi:hypothetical protein
VTPQADKLVLRTSGGFTGPAGAETRTVNLARLPAAQAAQLRRLVDESDVFTLPATLAKPQPQSWDFEHSLYVEAGGKTHTVRYHLDAAPPALRQLTEQINQLPRDE